MATLQLETSSGRKIADPSASQVADELGALPNANDGFATLSSGDETYVQTASSESAGFVLEYREGSADRHFKSTSKNLSIDAVTEVFQRYAAGDPSWKSRIVWSRMHANDAGGAPHKATLAVLALAMVVAVLFWALWFAGAV